MQRLGPTLAILLALGVGAPAGDSRETSWEKVKSLAGEWEGKYGDGTKAHVSYHLVSNGTAVMETLTTSDSDQMVTVYHLDGASLLMTHYCSLGNQSRMREKASGGPSLEFVVIDATNLKGPDDHHMSRLVMSFPASGRLVHEWTSKAGAREETGRFEFVRQK
jgi:hypothetical protein